MYLRKVSAVLFQLYFLGKRKSAYNVRDFIEEEAE